MLRALSLAGQIGADNLPMFTAIGAAPKLLGTYIERIGLELRHRERRYPGVAIFNRRLSLTIAANRPRRDNPGLSMAYIPTSHLAAQARGVHDIRVRWLRNIIVALIAADGMPIANT